MSNIVISADCTCDLSEEFLKKYDIQIIPFYINFKGKRFRDFYEVISPTIVEYLEKEDEIIYSSPPDVDDYKDYFKKISENGKKEVIHISIAKKISDGYKNALEASKNMDNVHIINSGLVSHGMGILTLAAVDFAKTETKADKIVERLKKVKDKISCSFILRSTYHISNNKRLNQWISNILLFFRIKPIIKIKNGGLEIGGLHIGNRESYARSFVKTALKRKKNISDDILFISVCGCSDDVVKIVYDEAMKIVPWKKIYVQDVSATSLCNIGANSIGIMFCEK